MEAQAKSIVIGFDSADVDFYTPILLGPEAMDLIAWDWDLESWLRETVTSLEVWPCFYARADARLSWFDLFFPLRNERGYDIVVYADVDSGSFISSIPGGGEMGFRFPRQAFRVSTKIGVGLTLRIRASLLNGDLYLGVKVVEEEALLDWEGEDFIALWFQTQGKQPVAEASITRPGSSEEWLSNVIAIAYPRGLGVAIVPPQMMEEALRRLGRSSFPQSPSS